MKKNNIVYGIIGVGVRNANYNAGFDKYPKQTAEGKLYATPQCLEYMIRKQLDIEGKCVLYKKSYKENGLVNDLKGRYESLFDTKDDKTDINKTKSNVFKATDVKLFGTVFTGASTFGITGAVQIGYGINMYDNTNIESEIILSPFASGDDKKNNTLGTQIFTDKAHYLHSFTLNPLEYDQYLHLSDFEGFTEEDYQIFKSTSLIAVSNYNSKAKSGCQNEFALFVETKEDTKNSINLNNLADYVSIKDDENNPEMIQYDLTKLTNILAKFSNEIKSIDMYYNPYTISLNGCEDLKCKYFNIITREGFK